MVKVRSGIVLAEDAAIGQTGVKALDNALDRFPVRNLQRFCRSQPGEDPRGLGRILEITADPDVNADNLLCTVGALGDIEYVEPVYRRTTSFSPGAHKGKYLPFGRDELPNDPYYPLQWMLPYVNVPAAWDIVTGDSTIVVANVDLGVDIDHSDLAQILWQNPLEAAGVTGIDDDGNGWVDDVYGWDFVDNDADPRPYGGDYHGTHTSGISIAATNNGIGGAGIARNCRLMSVRAGAGNSIFYGFAGIYYAAHTGARVINLSWGGYGRSLFEEDVVEDALAQGCLLVAAAGNEDADTLHFPAAYDAVVAVAALDQTGQKAGFSNYGTWVDIAAPGVQIFSTMNSNQWGYAQGTSQAAPVVSGIGALVASLHPDWDGQQLMSAVIASGDPIDDVNPLYENGLGTGCVNAFRAVDGGRGGLELDTMWFDDSVGGDGDGIPESGETMEMMVQLRNGIADENQVTGFLTEELSGVLMIESESNFRTIPGGGFGDNFDNPFEFSLHPEMRANREIRMALELRDVNNRRLRIIPIVFDANPSYDDHTVGNVRATLTDFGAFGYVEYVTPENPDYPEGHGSGFRYPQDGLNWLYHGSWVIGNSPNHVSDNSYGDAYHSRRDFLVEPGGELTISGPGVSDQDGIAIFNDNGATNPMNIRVTQRSYAWGSAPDDDYVIVEATVENNSILPLSSLYIGLFLDWDVAAYIDNQAGWDAAAEVGWTMNESFPSPWVGLAQVNGSPVSFRVVNNAYTVYQQGFPDSVKYRYLWQGIVTEHGATNGDWSLMIGSGPFELDPGGIASAAFAIGAGDTQEDLAQNMAAARTRYTQSIHDGIRKFEIPDVAAWELLPIYPNPYNEMSRIRILSRQPGDVAVYLYNVLGQRVTTIYQGPVEEGVMTLRMHQPELASGKYFCRLEAPGVRAVQSILLLR